MKSLPTSIAQALQDAKYTRVELLPRLRRFPLVDQDGAIRLGDDKKPLIEEREVHDLFVWPGNLRDATGNWPAQGILAEADVDYSEAAEVANGALRFRQLQLPHDGDPDPDVIIDAEEPVI